jgi:hypothetical protein
VEAAAAASRPVAGARMPRRWLLFVLALAGGGCDETLAPSLTATCSATPPSGPAPLAVRFALNVAGAQGAFDVRIDYGDGATGDDPAASHVYTSPGTYTAGFTVRTPTQSALCSTVVRADAPGGPAPTGAPTSPVPTPRPTPGGSNQAPDAIFRTTPAANSAGEITGARSLSVEINMCRTADPERDPLQFTIDFEGDGVVEVNGRTGGDCRRTRVYGPGTYRPRACVTDLNEGLGPNHAFQCRSWTVRVTPAS